MLNFVAYAHTCKLPFENITTIWPTWEFIVQVARVPCSHLPVRCSTREKWWYLLCCYVLPYCHIFHFEPLLFCRRRRYTYKCSAPGKGILAYEGKYKNSAPFQNVTKILLHLQSEGLNKRSSDLISDSILPSEANAP